MAATRPFHKGFAGRTGDVDFRFGIASSSTSDASHFHPPGTGLIERSGPFSVDHRCQFGQLFADVIGILLTQRGLQFITRQGWECDVVLERKFDGAISFNKLIQEFLIEGSRWPDEDILLTVVQFFPRLHYFAPSLVDQFLHGFMGQVVGLFGQFIFRSSNSFNSGSNFVGLRVILFLQG